MSGAKFRSLLPIMGVTSHASRLQVRVRQELFPCSASVRGRGRIGSPRDPLFSVVLSWAQPQRDMGGLHGLLDDGDQALTQLGEIDLIAKGGTEGSYGFGSIILAAIETTIDDVLKASP